MENRDKKAGKKPLLLPWVILAVFMAIVLIVVAVGTPIAFHYSNAINSFFDCQTYEVITEEIDADFDAEYYKSDFVQRDENGDPIYVTEENGYRHQVYDDAALSLHNYKKAEEAAAEGIALLWNNNDALPLASGSQVSCFSRSATDPLYGGGGSGIANPGGTIDFITGLTAAGLVTNQNLNSFYSTQPTRKTTSFEPFLMNETPWNLVTTRCGNTFSTYGDAAIIMLSRYSAEHWGDMFMSGSDGIDGQQLNFSEEELDMFEGVVNLKRQGVFKKVILVLNLCNFVNIGMIDNILPDIDACLWVGYPGNRGFAALGKIMTGEYNPSGHLPDTFAYQSSSAPATVTYGDYAYAGSEPFKPTLDYEANKYITYNEGIYVGYRYYETRYEDTVLNRYNALSSVGAVASNSGWNYTEEVLVPFGGGGSYTEFTFSNFSVTPEGDDYLVSVDVTNSGAKAGKAVAQIYLQKPYTEYDRQNGIEKASVELVGFAKTAALDPGSVETLTVTVDGEMFKTYDANGAGTYILEAGDYYLTAAENAHNAVNNILAEKGMTVADGMDAPGNADMAEPITVRADDFRKYARSAYTDYEITNRFDHADWNKAGFADGNTITYLSRQDWAGTYPVQKTLTMDQDLANALAYDKEFEEDPEAEMPTYGAQNGLSLVMMQGLDYNATAWQDLLDQMTFDEQAKMLADSYRYTHAITSINKPATRENDGPMGIRSTYANGNWAVTFPCAPIIGATFNAQLMYEVGEGKGEDILHCGHQGLYGTGANIHRLPHSGRNFEYYSEDPYLSGIGAAQETLGIQSNGVYCILKHYALNDQELNRWGVNIWANEQAVREIYLVPFEYAVTRGDAHGLMSSFSRVGALWAGGDYNLCTEVLRNEWAFDGFIISDCQVNPYMSYVDGVLAGNDLWLYSILGEGFHRWEDSPTVCQAMRESCHRVLYTVLHSSAMNGVTENSRINPIMTWWQYTLIALVVSFSVLTAAAVAVLAVAIVRRSKFNKHERENRV